MLTTSNMLTLFPRVPRDCLRPCAHASVHVVAVRGFCGSSGFAGPPSVLALDASTAYFFALPLVLTNVTVYMGNADCDGGPQQPKPNHLQHVR